MPIAFSCSCGKAMKAKEQFAGKKIKCTQCGTVVTIPQSPAEEEEQEVPPPLAKLAVKPPLARPVARPSLPAETEEDEDSPPLAKPVARPIGSRQKVFTLATPAPLHAWVDRSLMQQPTPWLPGDEERFQQGIKAPREGMSALAKGMLGVLMLGGLGAAGWFLLA